MSKPEFGYHRTEIKKGVLGEFSKITEEYLELQDAHDQGAKVMLLCELSDLVGAIDWYLKNHYPNVTIDDIIKFSKMTQNAFERGDR